MNRELIVHHAGPAVSVQDLGRTGFLSMGLSRGGAADRLAVVEGAALLGQDDGLAVLEMAGIGGEFEASGDLHIALTGAEMQATIDRSPVRWNACHALSDGQKLKLGSVIAGNYAYLHVGGGIKTRMRLGARSSHLAAGIGGLVTGGRRLPVGDYSNPDFEAKFLEPEPRFEGGPVRVVASVQTSLFSPNEIARFEATEFQRGARGNRMGVRLDTDAKGFHFEAGLSVLSDVIVPGDIQITGDGAPFILLCECQTTGGYPRIGTIIPCDLPRVAQAQPGKAFSFLFISIDQAVDIVRKESKNLELLYNTIRPLIRDPRDIPNLLAYQLISGVTSGKES